LQFIVGIDVGGTFTDACAVRVDGSAVYVAKVPTTPDDLIRGLLTGLEELADAADLDVEQLLSATKKFVHGTTQTSNVMFTWSGARTGLIATRGFGDELLIMRARGRVAGLSLTERRHLRNTQKPPTIVDPELIVEVNERVDARGNVLVALQPSERERAVRALIDHDVDAIAVALLFSPRNPTHELQLEDTIRQLAPDVHVSLSHRVAPILGEYERTSTTAVNAYVAPTLESYLERLQHELSQLGLRSEVLIVHADGGVAQVRQAVPVRTIESGPAAGMVAVKALASDAGMPDVIATDVGGTTFKVGLITNGDWGYSRETIINQYTLLIPMVDLISIGAGGGSIAWVDDARLRVGPRSAGSSPGPACYGWGGQEPTVTDADVVLGFIDPTKFLSGHLPLHSDLAEAALRRVADPLFAGDVTEAAAAVRLVVGAQMADLVRKASLERGRDPRRFALMAYGGAGPLHAASYARGLGIARIVVPRNATVYSAYGAAWSDLRYTIERSVPPDLVDAADELAGAFRILEQEATQVLSEQGVAPESVIISRSADMRYERQLHDIRVPLEPGRHGAASARTAFEARYRVLYGETAGIPDAGVTLMRIVIEAVGVTVKPRSEASAVTAHETPEAPASRSIYWPEVGEWIETSAFDGDRIGPGHTLVGPAVIDEPGTTIAVPPHATATVDARNYVEILLPEVSP
jgi:N-methylhydantoinase A